MVWVLLLQIQGGIAKTWYGFFFYKYKWSAKTWYGFFFYKNKGAAKTWYEFFFYKYKGGEGS